MFQAFIHQKWNRCEILSFSDNCVCRLRIEDLRGELISPRVFSLGHSDIIFGINHVWFGSGQLNEKISAYSNIRSFKSDARSLYCLIDFENSKAMTSRPSPIIKLKFAQSYWSGIHPNLYAKHLNAYHFILKRKSSNNLTIFKLSNNNNTIFICFECERFFFSVSRVNTKVRR